MQTTFPWRVSLPRRGWAGMLVIVLLLISRVPVAAGPASSTVSDTRTWEWITLPVGHGDAHLVISPEQEAAVIDAGSTTAYTSIRSALRCRGIRKIHTLVLTHPHWDHIGGASDLMEDFPVETVWDPMLSHSSSLHEQLRNTLQRRGVSAVKTRRGFRGALLPGVEARVLHPPANPSGGLNERSLALEFQLGTLRFLAMGDVVGSAERELLKLGLIPRTDVLKVAHHGDGAGTTHDFLNRAQPRVAIIPAPLSSNDPWGYPHDSVLKRLRNHRVRVFHTGRDGVIRVLVSPGTNPDFRVEVAPEVPCPARANQGAGG